MASHMNEFSYSLSSFTAGKDATISIKFLATILTCGILSAQYNSPCYICIEIFLRDLVASTFFKWFLQLLLQIESNNDRRSLSQSMSNSCSFEARVNNCHKLLKLKHCCITFYFDQRFIKINPIQQYIYHSNIHAVLDLIIITLLLWKSISHKLHQSKLKLYW